MTKKIIALALATVLVAGSAMAQKKKPAQPEYNGGITAEMMQQMKGSFGQTASDKALRNILVGQSPQKLAMNYENATKFDSHFSHRVVSKAVTDQTSGLNRITATYVKSLYTSESAYKTAQTDAAATTYNVVASDGGYTGTLVLGYGVSENQNAATPIVDYSGNTATPLYATYTFSSSGEFAITGLYTNADATTAATDYTFSGATITSSGTTNALTYTLTAKTYSDVTISLTSGTPTLSTSAITNITTTATGTAASDTAFVDATTGLSFTVSAASEITVNGTTTVANGGLYTDTTNQYTLTYTDVTGDGVTTDDTITVVTTALSDTTKLTATAAVTLDGTTYTLTSTYNATFHLPTMGHFSVTLSAHPQKCL